MLYRTVIIEDDSVITHLNRRYVEMDNRFCVVQTFSAAHPALFWLRSNPVDLIILEMESTAIPFRIGAVKIWNWFYRTDLSEDTGIPACLY